jgi:hypothetical protein
VLFFLELAETGFATHEAWYFSVENWGNFTALAGAPWTGYVHVIAVGVGQSPTNLVTCQTFTRPSLGNGANILRRVRPFCFHRLPRIYNSRPALQTPFDVAEELYYQAAHWTHRVGRYSEPNSESWWI